MVHYYNGVCAYVYEAAVALFDKCLKRFRKTHVSATHEIRVPKETMKKWLEDIRRGARSELLVSQCCQFLARGNTTTLPLKVVAQRNCIAEFIQYKLIFVKSDKFAF